MNSHEELELKKEFQLERIILFSDAVFAIIITIMVIDLKLPENIKEVVAEKAIKHAFLGILLKFVGYAVTFSLVARFWIRHLKIFSFLKDYNYKLLVLNLLFLFCVSLFPFAVSLITAGVHRDTLEYAWGMDIYITVFFLCIVSESLLINYLVKNRDTLCFSGDTIDSVLKGRLAKAMLIATPIFFVFLIIINFFEIDPTWYTYIPAMYGVTSSRLSKKYYPQSDDNRPFVLRMFTRRAKKIPKAKLPSGE